MVTLTFKFAKLLFPMKLFLCSITIGRIVVAVKIKITNETKYLRSIMEQIRSFDEIKVIEKISLSIWEAITIAKKMFKLFL
jgi:hypothetical protein